MELHCRADVDDVDDSEDDVVAIEATAPQALISLMIVAAVHDGRSLDAMSQSVCRTWRFVWSIFVSNFNERHCVLTYY